MLFTKVLVNDPKKHAFYTGDSCSRYNCWRYTMCYAEESCFKGTHPSSEWIITFVRGFVCKINRFLIRLPSRNDIYFGMRGRIRKKRNICANSGFNHYVNYLIDVLWSQNCDFSLLRIFFKNQPHDLINLEVCGRVSYRTDF